LYALDEHKSSDPQRGMCFVPRRAVNTSECEIARAYKLTTNSIEPIAFIVPRKVSQLFFVAHNQLTVVKKKN
jgi:coronin-1B/1C/6